MPLCSWSLYPGNPAILAAFLSRRDTGSQENYVRIKAGGEPWPSWSSPEVKPPGLTNKEPNSVRRSAPPNAQQGKQGEWKRCQAGERVMASVLRCLVRKWRRTVNPAKSAVARPAERALLGVRLANDGSLRSMAPQALTRFKRRVRDRTRRTRGVSLPKLMEP
jgi:hypothetical protein